MLGSNLSARWPETVDVSVVSESSASNAGPVTPASCGAIVCPQFLCGENGLNDGIWFARPPPGLPCSSEPGSTTSTALPIKSEEKTRLVRAEYGFDFLGVRFILKPTRRDPNRRFCYGFPSPKSMKAVRKKIRDSVGNDYQKSLDHKIQYLNPIVRGWANYYCWLNSGERFHKIERYALQRLNAWLRRKQNRVRRRFREPHAKTYFAAGLYRLSWRITHVY